TVFERVYSPERTKGAHTYYGTFNQRYGDAFKKAQASLVRKGLLVFAEIEDPYRTKTKLERIHVRFPQEFEHFLPPLAKGTVALSGPGEARQDVLREKLQEVTGRRSTSFVQQADGYQVAVVEGELRVGRQPFSARLLQEWQRTCWEAETGKPPAIATPAPADGIAPVAPIAAVTYALGELPSGWWVAGEALDAALKIFCNGGKTADGREVCAAGWLWGCLARQMDGGKTYYRLADLVDDQATQGSGSDPKIYLHVVGDGMVVVNLETIPYDALELMARMATLGVSDRFLTATPNLVKLGYNLPALRNKPLLIWLREHSPAFRQAWETVEARWGKQIIHENLLVARVTDPALRVQVERALPNRQWLIVLADEYVAFPCAWRNEVEKAVTKAGYVVKVASPAVPGTVKHGDKSKK
ncbi:MAG: hypothetical protein NT167_22435, partial [Verrucomicrobia bacterium]|nr:hypothetical protein [Verrucomicrobiota bacterium]